MTYKIPLQVFNPELLELVVVLELVVLALVVLELVLELDPLLITFMLPVTIKLP